MDTEGKALKGIFHFNRLKQAYLKTTKGSVDTIANLKEILNLGLESIRRTVLYECCVNYVILKYISSDLQT